jgi:hypothetical protein
MSKEGEKESNEPDYDEDGDQLWKQENLKTRQRTTFFEVVLHELWKTA